jgi:NADH dehydrogenase
VRVLVLERGQRILSAYAPELADYAVGQLGELGVHVRTSTIVETVEPWGVTLRSGERLRADNVFWAAGVTGSPLLAALSPEPELDRRGRALVLGDCSVPGFGEAFVIGDAACMFGALGAALPSVTAAAQQAGQHVGKLIAAEVADPRPSARPAFAYADKGSTLTLGRGCAVVQHQRKRMVGGRAWLTWLFAHVFSSIVWGKRLRTLLAWAFAYVTYGRGARVITGTEGAPFVRAPERSAAPFHAASASDTKTEIRLAN